MCSHVGSASTIYGHSTRRGCGPATILTISGRPVTPRHQHLANTACHAHSACAENVKRGVLQAGGFPIELPAMPLAEPFVKPSTMLYRNLLAMEAEEFLRSHPLDGAKRGGCDKTTPPGDAPSAWAFRRSTFGGRCCAANWRGEFLGSPDVWKYWMEKRAGNITEEQWNEMEGGIARSFGTCMVMVTPRP